MLHLVLCNIEICVHTDSLKYRAQQPYGSQEAGRSRKEQLQLQGQDPRPGHAVIFTGIRKQDWLSVIWSRQRAQRRVILGFSSRIMACARQQEAQEGGVRRSPSPLLRSRFKVGRRPRVAEVTPPQGIGPNGKMKRGVGLAERAP